MVRSSPGRGTAPGDPTDQARLCGERGDVLLGPARHQGGWDALDSGSELFSEGSHSI